MPAAELVFSYVVYMTKWRKDVFCSETPCYYVSKYIKKAASIKGLP